MKGYYTAKRLLSNIDWRSMHDMPLVIKGHTIVAFELRPKEKNVWALGVHFTDFKNIVLAIMKRDGLKFSEFDVENEMTDDAFKMYASLILSRCDNTDLECILNFIRF